MPIEKHPSRRGLICAALASIPLTRMGAAEGPPRYGLESLLDGTSMARIPAGEFTMGSEFGNPAEMPAHRVRITRAFEIGKFEVTQSQWETVMVDPHAPGELRPTPGGSRVGSNPSHFKGPSLPVESVSWDDIQAFLIRLNAREPTHVYRLPTEAEWEYAAWAGRPLGDPKGIGATAWYQPNSEEHTQPVGTKDPNAWGVHDMRGNVSEWVQDWFDYEYYDDSPKDDPRGPDMGEYRVYRGGCWFDSAQYCRQALRRFDFPISRFYNVGVRVVRTPK
jgi:formylglycine-generating enzyme required for sulfatase activity